MNRIVFLLALMLSFLVGNTQTISEPYRLFPKSNFAPPIDTIIAPVKVGELRSRPADQKVYQCISLTGHRWVALGGDGVNIYNSDGTFTGPRVANLNGNEIHFTNPLNFRIGDPPSGSYTESYEETMYTVLGGGNNGKNWSKKLTSPTNIDDSYGFEVTANRYAGVVLPTGRQAYSQDAMFAEDALGRYASNEISQRISSRIADSTIYLNEFNMSNSFGDYGTYIQMRSDSASANLSLQRSTPSSSLTISLPSVPVSTASRTLPISVNGNFADAAGNITVAGGGGGESTTASNGLTVVGTDVRLGGTLNQTTTINAGNNPIYINSTISGTALTVGGGTNGGQFSGTSTGLVGISDNIPFWSINTSTANSSSLRDAFVSNQTGVNASAGFGSRVQFNANRSNGTSAAMGTYNFSWTNATVGSETAKFHISLRNNGTAETEKFAVAGNGRLTASGYGSGTLAGTATYLIGTDASGNFVETSAGSLSSFSGKLNLGTATNWNAAHDNPGGFVIREILKIGDISNNNMRTITINAIVYVTQSNFTGTNQWVQCGLITDASYRPTHSVYWRGPTIIDATKYANPGGTAFTGNAAYGDMNLRIDPNGQIFVYINSISSYPQLSGSNIVVVPLNITYFVTTTG